MSALALTLSLSARSRVKHPRQRAMTYDARDMGIRTAAPLALTIALSLSCIGASCGQSALGIMPGVVNNPQNLSLRRAILTFGTNSICSEMLKRSIPLRLRDEDPSTGRFYANACYAQQVNGGTNVFVQFSGYGYAWTNLTKRASFDAGGAIEYETDFLMDGETMYVYFRQKNTSNVTFKTRFIEQPQSPTLSALPLGASVPGGEAFVNSLGLQVLRSEVARGFTVIRDDDGAAAFGLGVVDKGKRPATPYRISPSGRAILANERSEVHQNQRDFVGPIEVTGKGQALYLTAAVDGAPGADLLLVPRVTADAWLQTYTTQGPLTPPPSFASLDEPIYAGMMWRRTVALPPGMYYLVIDNTAAAGKTQPTSYGQDDRAAMVSYAIELGDAP